MELARLRRGRKRSSPAKSRVNAANEVGGVVREDLQVQQRNGVSKETIVQEKKGCVVVIGAAILDITSKLLLPDVQVLVCLLHNIHTHIHTYIHTYIHIYIYTHTYTHIHIHTHTYIHT